MYRTSRYNLAVPTADGGALLGDRIRMNSLRSRRVFMRSMATRRQHVATKIGPTARPKAVIPVPDLPKTRSGKIMRRLLRDVVEGRDLGDTTTLADAGVVEEIRNRAASSPQED